MLKVVCIAAGSVCTALGVIGIFIPVLPTTPFLLLAAFFYFRGSKRLYRWLTENRILGKYIRDYMEKRAMPLHAKIIALILLWVSIPVCIFFHIPYLWADILLAVVLAAVTAHILLLGTSR